ncbi:hypothetical protein LWM68_14680 [Niabella sp. W65]|nr:hypothetical protein [Niabella sp. W65]MCH7363888.1 hypothetical protein [Niabella sp. W65]
MITTFFSHKLKAHYESKRIYQSGFLLSCGAWISGNVFSFGNEPVSGFSRRLRPVGRALELEGYYVWCNTPIKGPDDKIHVFFSRWDARKK